MLIETDDIREVRTKKIGSVVTVRLRMKNGTWVDLTATGTVEHAARLDDAPVVRRKSFDYESNHKEAQQRAD